MRAMTLVLTIALLNGSASAALADHKGECQALHDAAFMDEPSKISALIDHGVDIDCLDMLGQTPLVTAMNGASMDSFTLLMDAGARTDVRTEYGQTLLQHAKKKYDSFPVSGGEGFRTLYRAMIDRLEIASRTQ